jgi:hypothetical protein
VKRIVNVCWRGICGQTDEAWLGPQGEVYPKSEVILRFPDGTLVEA